MSRLLVAALVLLSTGCETPWVHRDFWLRVAPQTPGEQFDPFSGVCTLESEEWRTFGPPAALEVWVVRHYLCPQGVT